MAEREFDVLQEVRTVVKTYGPHKLRLKPESVVTCWNIVSAEEDLAQKTHSKRSTGFDQESLTLLSNRLYGALLEDVEYYEQGILAPLDPCIVELSDTELYVLRQLLGVRISQIGLIKAQLNTDTRSPIILNEVQTEEKNLYQALINMELAQPKST